MGKGKGNGQGNGNGLGNRGRGRPGRSRPTAARSCPACPGGQPGNGLGRGPGALGDVLHGEYTTNVTGTPTVMVVQTGAGHRLHRGQVAHREELGRLRGDLRARRGPATTRGGTVLATGVQVRVVAAKEGMKVTRLVG